MKIEKKFLTLMLSISLVFIMAGNALAKEKLSIQLKPSSDSYIKLDSVQLVQYSDDKIEVLVSGKKKAGTGPQHFKIEIDPNNKTYKTIKKDESEIIAQKPDDSEKIEAQSVASYENSVFVTTEDPIYIDCCYTGLTLGWTVSDGNISSYYREKWDWDGQPTLGLTYWYLNYNNYGPYYQYPGEIRTSSEGQHYNYDFLSNDKATYAQHNIHISGYDSGDMSYSTSWSHWGEAYNLLHASVDVY